MMTLVPLCLLLFCNLAGAMKAGSVIPLEAGNNKANEDKSASSGGFWETQLAPKAVDVPFGNLHLAVWEHLTKPGKFYVSPLVILLPDSIEYHENILTGSSAITLDILMWSDEARDAVYYSLEQEQRGLEKNDISLLPMDKIRLVWKGSVSLDNSILTLPDTWMSNTHKQRVVSFEFVCHNRTLCKDVIVDAIKENPQYLNGLELEYVISAKRTSTKHLAVSGTSFMSSSLFANMANMPNVASNVRYIESNDLNTMASQVALSIVATTIRDYNYEANVDSLSVSEIIKNFLAQHAESTEFFDESKWDSVFWNPDYARPDKVISALNDYLNKNSTTLDDSELTESSEDQSGKLNFIEIFNADGGSMSSSKRNTLDKLSNLWENKTQASWNGEKFDLKPMIFYRVNLATFNTSNSVTFTDVKLYPNEKSALIKVDVEHHEEERRQTRSLQLTQLSNRLDDVYEKIEHVFERIDLVQSEMEEKINDSVTLLVESAIESSNQTNQKMEKPIGQTEVSHRLGDCTSIKADDPSAGDGVYTLNLPGHGHVQAQCRMLDGRGWTVLLFRDSNVKPHPDFNRGFAEYSLGFGNVSGEHWLGLEAMHSLTNCMGRNRLRVEFRLADGTQHWIEYSGFSVKDKDSLYKLSIGYKDGGTAPEKFKSYHDGMYFSTFDDDNDKASSSHCAQTYQSGWWYNGCHAVLLTGEHGSSDKFKWNPYYLAYAVMMVS